ncbi:sugar ABC transporter ATP-binding protein [Clostridium estertheticum]|uniref:sugar ABC transporter ATP-binding protein n=1 Tax=Clostridium estertheticum TaxID=238834 RepID=UPI001CF54ADD|nr:sugar ABC transporter ATP-binding protein [Clostridium estertheticum]MCB2362325.1 sugar ABC transporter ATP-binding protein [Clostridium estertheticum]
MNSLNALFLDMRNISIEFPGVKALDNVNFTAETGKVQAIVGANGAGKSTLMNVLSGAYNHFTGDIFIDGKKSIIKVPADAKKLGIQVVYQEVDIALISYLTVGENILLDDIVNNMKNRLFLNWKDIHKQAAEALKKLNLNISTKKYIYELTLAQKQMVLIARSICRKCKLLILDEPTAPLSHFETGELFRVVNELKKDNVGIIFISHRLPELFKICDEVTVMRNGKIVVKRNIVETTQNQIVEDMLGRKLGEIFPKRNRTKGEKILEVINLKDKNKLNDINLQLHRGEIIGVAGLVGAGKTELCKALFGDAKLTYGKFILEGKEVILKSPYDAVRSGLALIPEERRKEGILANESIITNISATNIERFSNLFGFLEFEGERKVAKKIIKTLGIQTPDENRVVGLLSGGNQQKVVIGKWLDTDAKIFIFDEPTKGVDVGAKREIFNLINKLAMDGKGVIYASSELSEIMGITDRVYVIYDGKIEKELDTNSISEEELLFYSTGGK